MLSKTMIPVVSVCAYLLASVITGESVPLQTRVEGTDRVESCIGENITFTCNVSGLAHIWTAPGLLPPNTVVTPTIVDEVTSQYTLRLVSFDGFNSISSLTVIISDAEFNNINVTCSNPLGSEVQQRNALVLAPPSSPSLTAVGTGNLVSFIFTLSPPSISPECVLSYTITSTNSDGAMFNISVNANAANPGALIPTIRGGYNLCRYTYSFTVVGVTLVGSGGRSSRINQEPVDYSFIGMVTGIRTTSEALIWSIPSNTPNNCFSHYTVSLEGSSRGLANFTTKCNIASFVDLNSAGFPCYTHQTITITPVTTNGTAVTTSSGSVEVYSVPGLLSSVPVITHEYTTTRTIVIMVDVNEGINCLDKDQLHINTSISDSSGVISSSNAFFSDGLVLLGILSPGPYTCSVSVMNGNERLESVDIPCQTSVTSAALEISLTTIVTFIFTLLLVFDLGLLVMWLMKVRKRKSENISSSEGMESKTPFGPIYEIVETHLHQGDDVGTSSGDVHVTHMSSPSDPVYDTVSEPGDIQLETNQAYGPPSGGEGHHVSPPSDPVYDTVSEPGEIQLETNQAWD